MTKDKKFYSLANDSVFKNVFYRDDALLKRFLTDILSAFYDDVDIKNFKVLNTELTKDKLYIKNKVVDILVDISTKVINIEVNVKYDDYRIYRNFFYLASSTIASMKKDMKFVDVREHVQFNFNFKKSYKAGYKISEYGDLSTGEVTIPFMRTIDIDVDYYKNKWYNSGKSKEYYEQFKSIIMFGLTEDELKNLEDSDDYMKKIKDDVIKLNGDPNFYQAMTDEEDREMIENSIFISGKKEGIEENQKNIVKNMKEANYKAEDIKEITGLSIEEIEKI